MQILGIFWSFEPFLRDYGRNLRLFKYVYIILVLFRMLRAQDLSLLMETFDYIRLLKVKSENLELNGKIQLNMVLNIRIKV